MGVTLFVTRHPTPISREFTGSEFDWGDSRYTSVGSPREG
jgi:hypothetical protein